MGQSQSDADAPSAGETARLLRARRSAVKAVAPAAELVAVDVVRLPLRTPTLPPATTTNHYVVGDRAAVMVDPAAPGRHSQATLAALVARWREAAAPVRALFLTHHHQDHAGAAKELSRQLALPVWAHAETARLLPGLVDRLVGDGEVVAESARGVWTARHTPGHAPGHLILQGPERGMIVGDMVAGQGTILIDPRDGHMGEYLASLRTMASLAPSWLAPAHGPVLHEPQVVLARYIAHRLAREARVRGALTQGPQPADALLDVAYADTPRRLWPLALRSLRAHLLWLQEQGYATQVSPGQWRAP